MLKTAFLFLTAILIWQRVDAQREEKKAIIQKMDALMGMQDACVMPHFENSFVCHYILNKSRNCQAKKAIGHLVAQSFDSLHLEGFAFHQRKLHHQMRLSNHKKNCTSLSCKEFRQKSPISYSCPLLSEDKRQALVFVHYYKGKLCKSAKLYRFAKIGSRWKIIEKIKYFTS